MGAMPLDGVRILDFTWVVAGPVATRILGDHGAQVVKVERKDPPPMGNRKLGLQCDLHRSKLSVALNMQHPKGVELARRLAATSDIVMDNFSARVMRTWGMDYESLKAVKPDIICISMSGLGHTGPRLELRQLRADAAGAHGIHAVDGGGRRHAGGLRLLVRRHVRRILGRARSAGRIVASTAHGRRPVRRSVAVRGGRERRSVPRCSTSRSMGARSRRPATIHRKGRPRRTAFTNVARSTATTIDGSRSASAPDPNGVDSSSRSVLRNGRANQSSARSTADAKQRRAGRQRLAMDRGAQRGRRDGDTATRGNRSRRRRERRRSMRTRSATERARLLAGGLDAGRAWRLTSPESRSSFPVGREKFARSRLKSARISTTSSASC